MYTALLSSVSFWVHQGMQTNPLLTAFIHVWKNLHTSSGSVYSKPWSFSSMTYLIPVLGTKTFLYQSNSALYPWVTALGAWHTEPHGATGFPGAIPSPDGWQSSMHRHTPHYAQCLPTQLSFSHTPAAMPMPPDWRGHAAVETVC